MISPAFHIMYILKMFIAMIVVNLQCLVSLVKFLCFHACGIVLEPTTGQ